jgi:hypothetical protein
MDEEAFIVSTAANSMILCGAFQFSFHRALCFLTDL